MKNLYVLKKILSKHLDDRALFILRAFPESFFGSYKILKEKMTILYGRDQHLEEIHLTKKKLAIKFYVLALIFIALMVFLTVNMHLQKGEIHVINRPNPMEGKELHHIKVEMTDDRYTYKEKMKINITERIRTEGEINAIFTAATERLKVQILKKNSDLLHVYTDLNLYTVDQENGIHIRWKSHNENLMSSQGKVYSTSIDKEETVTLEFELSISEKKKTGYIDVKIVPFMEYATPDEIMNMKLSHLMTEISQDKSRKAINLPKTLESIHLRWYEEREDLRGALVIGFGITLFILLHTKYASIDRKIKRNRIQIENEYPNFIAKLVLLLSAGLIFQSSIEKIVSDYSNKSVKKNYFYDQLAIIIRNIEESKAYLMDELEEFSKRCCVKEMLRFTVIVKENITTGDLLSEKLSREAEQTWRNRKRKAEELGKLAETKLVFPMVILLMVLIMIVMMPALLEMK